MDLRTVIFDLNLKQKDVAEKAGVSEQLISNFIRGRNNLSEDSAKAVAKAVKCDAIKTVNGWDFQQKASARGTGLPSGSEGVAAGDSARGRPVAAGTAV